MPALNYVAPSGTVDSPLDHALSPDSGTQLRCSWISSGLVSFTGHFRNRSTGALFGPQTFVNDTSGNWFFSHPAFNGATPFGFELDSITSNGHSIAFTFSDDSGSPYSGLNQRRTSLWEFAVLYLRRASAWVWTPLYLRRTSAWALSHK